MVLILLLIGIGGIFTAWGIAHIPVNGETKDIRKSCGFWFAIGIWVLLLVRLIVDPLFEPPKTGDTFIGWLNLICLLAFLVSVALIIRSISQASEVQRGMAAVIFGGIVVLAGSLPLFHPRIFDSAFRSVFVITPAEFLAAVLFFLLGMSFVLASGFWRLIWDHLAKELPEHPLASAIVISMLVFSVFLIASMPSFVSNWLTRLSGIKTPFLEAQFSATHSREVLRVPTFDPGLWPNELLPTGSIREVIALFIEYEELIHGEETSLVGSLRALDVFLRKSGHYDFLDSLNSEPPRKGPLVPHIRKVKEWTACWAMYLRSQSGECEKGTGTKLSEEEFEESKKNPIYHAIVAFLFQFSEDFTKAARTWDEGIKNTHQPLGISYLQFWKGYFINNRYRGAHVQEISNQTLEAFSEAIRNLNLVLMNLSAKVGLASKAEDVKRVLDTWRKFQLQVKSGYISIAADTGRNEWSTRRYMSDLESALQDDGTLIELYPMMFEPVAWAKVRFNGSDNELRDAKRLFFDLEEKVTRLGTTDIDQIAKLEMLDVLRSHLQEADRALGVK